MTGRLNTETREHILRVAQRLIYEHGFKGISMGGVAAVAGIKKANLFHYYPTKEMLGLAVFDHAAADFKNWIASQLGETGADPIRTIEAIFDGAADSMRQTSCSGGCFVGNLAQELSDHNENFRLKVAEVFNLWTAQLSALLEQGRSSGYFRPELQPRAAAEAILSLFEGAMLVAKARKDPAPIKSAKLVAVAYLRSQRAKDSYHTPD